MGALPLVSRNSPLPLLPTGTVACATPVSCTCGGLGVGVGTNSLPVIGFILGVVLVVSGLGTGLGTAVLPVNGSMFGVRAAVVSTTGVGVLSYGLPVIGLTPVRGVAVLTCVSVAALLVTAPNAEFQRC